MSWRDSLRLWVQSLVARLFSLVVFRRTRRERAVDIPWRPLSKSLQDSTVALVTFAGVYRQDQEPFDLDRPGGDASFRVIPVETPASALAIRHGHYDQTAADADVNCVFPLDRLRDLAAMGEIGAPSPVHVGMRGYLPNSQLLLQQSAPAIARLLLQNGTDVVVLSPG